MATALKSALAKHDQLALQALLHHGNLWSCGVATVVCLSTDPGMNLMMQLQPTLHSLSTSWLAFNEILWQAKSICEGGKPPAGSSPPQRCQLRRHRAISQRHCCQWQQGQGQEWSWHVQGCVHPCRPAWPVRSESQAQLKRGEMASVFL